ncbi:MAG: phosphate/phosphite/phosphonate ABC transporter substrate-binding protein [Actinobacteria bacterium]|nr:phosphate/phosphite/phosphonate ABC transporter substrate-binding protein [Actinomycetota bacterium]
MITISVVATFLFVFSLVFSFFRFLEEERETLGIKQNQPILEDKNEIHLSISGMITPSGTYPYYIKIIKYISQKLKRPVILVQRRTYAEVNDLIKEGEIDIAFFADSYVEALKEGDVELLVVPQVKGESVRYSYIIVRENSDIVKFDDLKGKSFAFTKPLSASGEIYPSYLIKKAGFTPKSYFSEYVYTHNYSNSIRAVKQKEVDGAAVDSLKFAYLSVQNPKQVDGLKIIQKSPPFGISPWVVRSNLDSKLKKELEKIFLTMDEDPEGQKILKGLFVDKFVKEGIDIYNPIEEMVSFVGE